ncbi:hypothetical protein BU15DRAFT_75638 [Melanogaster broomeanus]|nr:hypothetical protein BU15DRAFT_75638 [Melanogaster broomeanus]
MPLVSLPSTQRVPSPFVITQCSRTQSRIVDDGRTNHALTYIKIKGYLDKLHEQGFISKSALVDQNKVDYITMDKMLEKVASNLYHGHKLTRTLENWAQEGMLRWSLDEIDGYSVDECEIILD